MKFDRRSATAAIRAGVEPTVARLIALTQTRQEVTADLLGWLQVEFGVDTPGQRLQDFATLDEGGFLDEVRRRRPKAAGRLGPKDVRLLRDTFGGEASRLQGLTLEAQRLERRLAALVNQAYDLTDAEAALLDQTAPPRMPHIVR